MKKIINSFFFYLKIVLLLITFGLVMYVMFSMHEAVDNSYCSYIMMIVPFTLLLLVFIMSFFFTKGRYNTFFNISCTVAILALLVISFRTISDTNMVMWSKWQMNLAYFKNNIMLIKVLLYLMTVVNILLFLKKEKNVISNQKK